MQGTHCTHVLDVNNDIMHVSISECVQMDAGGSQLIYALMEVAKQVAGITPGP